MCISLADSLSLPPRRFFHADVRRQSACFFVRSRHLERPLEPTPLQTSVYLSGDFAGKGYEHTDGEWSNIFSMERGVRCLQLDSGYV